MLISFQCTVHAFLQYGTLEEVSVDLLHNSYSSFKLTKENDAERVRPALMQVTLDKWSVLCHNTLTGRPLSAILAQCWVSLMLIMFHSILNQPHMVMKLCMAKG